MQFGKENFKKFIAMITVCVLLVGLFPTGVYAEPAGTGISWGADITESITGNVLTLSGTGAMNNFGATDNARLRIFGIVSIIIEDGITTVGTHAFRSSGITSVTIPCSVTSIGDWAFSQNKLTSIEIPNSVTSIGVGAFMLNELSLVVVPDSVVDLGANAFRENNLTSVTLPSSITNIGEAVFYDNELTSIEIPNSVNVIEQFAFELNKLTSVIIPDSVISLGASSFRDNDLTSVKLSNSITTIETAAFYNNKLESITIPDTVISIGAGAFGINNLTSLLIPNSVANIGEQAFVSNNLTQITMPNNVTIGTNLLVVDTNNLKDAYASGGAGTYNGTQTGTWTKGELLSTGVIWGADITESITGNVLTLSGTGTIKNFDTTDNENKLRDKSVDNVVIESGITTIGNYAFRYNDVTSVTIPNSVTSIGNYAFSENKLTFVTLSNSLTTISEGAFRDNNLTSVTIPDSVRTIDNAAFMGNNLTSVTIPDSVTSIGAFAFHTNNLTSITINSTGVTIGDNLLALNSNFRDAYTAGGAGTYVGTQEGVWTKVVPVPVPAPKPDFSIEPNNPAQVGKTILTVTTLADSTIYYKQVDKFTSRNLGEHFNPNGWTVYTSPTTVSATNGTLFEVVIVDTMGKVVQSGGFELYDGTLIDFNLSIEIPEKIMVGNVICFGVDVSRGNPLNPGWSFASSNPDVATLLWTGTPGLKIIANKPGTVDFTLKADDDGAFKKVISVEVVSKSALGDAITFINALEESKYTPDTYTVLYNLSLEIKNAFYDYHNLTFAEYEALVSKFNDARNGLVLRNVADVQAVATAKAAIVSGTVNVAFGADQIAKTAAVQTYVNNLLKGDAAGVTATVTHASGNSYSVAISKGSVTDTKSITMTINESANPELTTVNNAKTAAEGTSYSNMNQGEATDESAIGNAIKAEAEAAVNDNSVTVTINKISYTAAIAGTSANPSGTNGSYVFTITVSKGEETQTTEQKNITITATVYSPIPTYIVSGNVKDSNDVDVSNAVVKLMFGQTRIGSTVLTNARGEFIITGVPNGTYNLVVQKDDIIVTTLITVSGGNYASGAITLPNGKTNSIVEVKSDTPSIVVGGLDAQFAASTSTEHIKGITEEDKNVVASGGTVEIKFTAEKKADNAAPNASDIKTTASNSGKTVGIFLDLSVSKTVTEINTVTGHVYASTTTRLIELQNPIQVLIPLDEAQQNKSSYVVYRYHGTSVDTITTTANAYGEKIDLIDNGKTIQLTIKKFSTYAIAYTKPGQQPAEPQKTEQKPESEVPLTDNDIYIITKVKVGDQGITQIELDKEKTKDIFDKDSNKKDVIITVDLNNEDGSKQQGTQINIPAQIIDIIEQRGGTISVITDEIVWRISSSQLKDIINNSRHQQAGATQDIKVTVTTKVTDQERANRIIETATRQGMEVVSNLFDFNVATAYNQRSYASNSLFGYTTIRIPVPLGLEKYTTAVRFDDKGNMYHIPTNFKWINGRLYAQINSFTSGTYGIVYTPRTFDDVRGNWSEKAVTNMASRLIVAGIGDNRYEPDRSITRAEFVTLLVKSLGLSGTLDVATAEFSDVTSDKWYYEAIQIARVQGFVKGYDNNEFKPQEIINQQEAMIMLARAARFAGLAGNSQGTTILNNYIDQSEVDLWAKDDVESVVGLETFTGFENNDLKPKERISRSQSAQALSNLLTISQLINP